MCKNKAELNNLVDKYRKLNAEKKKLDKQLKEVKEDITEYVLAKGEKGGKDDLTLIVFGDGYKISYITVVAHPLDTDKIKEYFGESIAQFQTESISNKLTVS